MEVTEGGTSTLTISSITHRFVKKILQILFHEEFVTKSLEGKNGGLYTTTGYGCPVYSGKLEITTGLTVKETEEVFCVYI